MAKRPERLELLIESVGARGDGIARLGTSKVFVPFTLPGERVEAFIEHTVPDGLVALAGEWIEESPERIAAPCPHFEACGGCALQHWSDAGYAAWKVELLRTALRRQGIEAPVEPLRRTPPHARRRAGFVARFGGRGVKLGFRERSSHRLVPVAACPVLRPSLERFALEAPPLLAGLDAPNAEWALDAGERSRERAGERSFEIAGGALPWGLRKEHVRNDEKRDRHENNVCASGVLES